MFSSTKLVMADERTITKLEDYVEQLDPDTRKAFECLFRVSTDIGRLKIPESFRPKVLKYFKQGSESPEETYARVEAQTIIKTFNRLSLEGALFNELRTNKPGSRNDDKIKLRKKINRALGQAKNGCDFGFPEMYTSEVFGSTIYRESCTVRENAAKYDSNNALIIFKESNPLDFDEKTIAECFDISSEWWSRANKFNPAQVYPFLGWNCLKKAGASQDWAHMHSLLTKDFHYASVERQRLAMQTCNTAGGDYFKDLFRVHESLGLGIKTEDSDIMAYLTPVKDKEVVIVSKNLESLAHSVYQTLVCFRDKLGVYAFNMALQLPPLEGTKERQSPEWSGFPYIARIVDRGHPFSKGADIAIMELYGSPVIGSDPFKVARELSTHFKVDLKPKSQPIYGFNPNDPEHPTNFGNSSNPGYDPCHECAERLMGVGGAPCVGCTTGSR